MIFTGDPLTPASLTKEATAQNYFPEWVIGSNVLVDIALFARTYDQEQWKHAFGLALTPTRTNQDARESYNLYKWEYGKPPPNNTYGVIIVDPIVLFSGLQLAGPDLTPQTFQDGLFRAPVGAAASFEGEDPVTGDAARRRDRHAEQLDETTVEIGPSGKGFEGAASALVLNMDPLERFGRCGCFEPPVRISDVVTVEDIDGVAARGDRRGVRAKSVEVGQISLGRSSASCRGLPCSAACAPCASSSSWT